MPTLHIRNVPEPVYESIRDLARRENRSLNAQVITLLAGAVSSGASIGVVPALDRARRVRESQRPRRGPSSLSLLHAGRGERSR
jgi:hypothetical protein